MEKSFFEENGYSTSKRECLMQVLFVHDSNFYIADRPVFSNIEYASNDSVAREFVRLAPSSSKLRAGYCISSVSTVSYCVYSHEIHSCTPRLYLPRTKVKDSTVWIYNSCVCIIIPYAPDDSVYTQGYLCPCYSFCRCKKSVAAELNGVLIQLCPHPPLCVRELHP